MQKLFAFKQPTIFSLSQAINEIFSSQQIAEQLPNATDSFSLLALLCKANSLSEEKSYRYLAKKSGFPFVSRLHLPAEETLQQVASALEVKSYIGLAPFFKKRGLLPQQSLDGVGCVLLTSDPGVLEREFSYTPNIPVYLSEHSKIAAVWKLYDDLFHSLDACRVFERAVVRLSKEAYGRGAQEVFIWRDSICRYEYFAYSQRFFGEIAYGVLEGLFEELPYRSFAQCDGADTTDIEISVSVPSTTSVQQLVIIEFSVAEPKT